MAELGKLYLYWTLICFGLIAPGLAKAEKRGAWEPDKEPATKKEETQIFEGCGLQVELAFYMAQEKVYAQGNTDKMLKYLKGHMSEAEYTVKEAMLRRLGEWVDNHHFKTAKEYARYLMRECVDNSYDSFQKSPTPLADVYMQRFNQTLLNVQERLYPGKDVSA